MPIIINIIPLLFFRTQEGCQKVFKFYISCWCNKEEELKAQEEKRKQARDELSRDIKPLRYDLISSRECLAFTVLRDRNSSRSPVPDIPRRRSPR